MARIFVTMHTWQVANKCPEESLIAKALFRQQHCHTKSNMTNAPCGVFTGCLHSTLQLRRPDCASSRLSLRLPCTFLCQRHFSQEVLFIQDSFLEFWHNANTVLLRRCFFEAPRFLFEIAIAEFTRLSFFPQTQHASFSACRGQMSKGFASVQLGKTARELKAPKAPRCSTMLHVSGSDLHRAQCHRGSRTSRRRCSGRGHLPGFLSLGLASPEPGFGLSSSAPQAPEAPTASSRLEHRRGRGPSVLRQRRLRLRSDPPRLRRGRLPSGPLGV